MSSNTPAEELDSDDLSPSERFNRHHDSDWTAPSMDLDAEEDFARAESDKLSIFGTTEIWDGEEKQVTRPSSTRSSSRSRTREQQQQGSPTSSSAQRSSANRQGAFQNSPEAPARELSPRTMQSNANAMQVSGGALGQQGVSTTTSKVVTSSSNTTSSTFTQSSSTKSTSGITAGASLTGMPSNNAAMQILQQQQQMLRASADSNDSAGSRPTPKFSKKFQPMSADSDSD